MKAAEKRIPLFDTNEDKTLRIQGELATKIGFNESIVLMQLEFLISISNHVINEKAWTWQTLEDLKSKYFPWWSIATISRTLKSLEGQGIIFIDSFNKRKGDKTQWFALNFEKIEELGCVKLNKKHTIFQNAKWYPEDYKPADEAPQEEIPILQDARPIFHNEKSILQDETTLPENTPEITTKDNPNGVGDKPPPEPDKPKKQLMGIFITETGLKMPHRKSDVGFWWSSIREIYEIVDNDVGAGGDLIRQAVKRMRADSLTISNPNSIINICRTLAAKKSVTRNGTHLSAEQLALAQQYDQELAQQT